MNKKERVAEMAKLPNLGPVSAEWLVNAGIDSKEKLVELGAKEAFLRVFEQGGWRSCMCACFLYAMEGVIAGEKWNEISQGKKDELKKFSREVRDSLPGVK